MENVIEYSVLTITLKRRPLTTEYTFHSRPLAFVNSAKYLGTTINSKLSFNDHIDAICNKAISFLHRNFSSCQHTIKSDLYLTYVKPILYQFGLFTLTINLLECCDAQFVVITAVPVVSLPCYHHCNGPVLRYNLKKYVLQNCS